MEKCGLEEKGKPISTCNYYFENVDLDVRPDVRKELQKRE